MARIHRAVLGALVAALTITSAAWADGPVAYIDQTTGKVTWVRQDVGLPVICESGCSGGGGGGGPVTAISGAFVDGWNVTAGAEADTACATDNGTCTSQALWKRANQRLTTLNTTLGTPMQTTGGTVGLVAGSAVIGHVINDAGSAAIGTVGGTPVALSTASSSAEACHVFKASAGTVYSVSGYVGAAAWIMAFNATSAPGDGAVTPVAWAYAPVAGSWSINYGANPATYTTGVTVCASSTGPLTKTAYSTNTVFAGQVQ